MQQDAIIIGGGFAGLSAAYILGRARRKVTIIDSGTPRNRFSAHAHGVLAQDGKPGTQILAEARAQLAAYETVSFVDGEAHAIRGAIDDFSVEVMGYEPVSARRLLLSAGMEDGLPDIPGIRERWGKTVLHCPYCHGYEIGGGAIGVLATHPMAAHQAAVVADWGDVTLFTNDTAAPDQEALDLLERRKVRLQAGTVTGIADAEDGGLRVSLQNGETFGIKALFVGPSMRLRGGLAEALGCDLEETPGGTIIATNGVKATSIPGVYAAGDSARAFGNITLASADGVMAAFGLHQSLMFSTTHP